MKLEWTATESNYILATITANTGIAIIPYENWWHLHAISLPNNVFFAARIKCRSLNSAKYAAQTIADMWLNHRSKSQQ